jgi:hypothetical protein
MYIVWKYQIHFHSLRNKRIEKFTKGLLFYLFLKLVQINIIFTDNLYISSTDKTDRHDITEILLKVALNTITLTSPSSFQILYIGLHTKPVLLGFFYLKDGIRCIMLIKTTICLYCTVILSPLLYPKQLACRVLIDLTVTSSNLPMWSPLLSSHLY